MFDLVAQKINNPALGPGYSGLTGEQFFSRLIPALIAALLVIGAIVFIFTLLMGSIEWITAGGDKGKIESARQRVSNALVGLLVLFSLFAIVNLLECFFGIGMRSVTIAAFDVRLAGTPVCK